MSCRGLTIVEAMFALALLGIAATALMSAIMVQVETNNQNEIRASAVTAAEQVLESLRLIDPSAMPKTGSGAPTLVEVGGLEFETVTRYCTEPAICTVGTRHLIVEVHFEGETLYDVETVYTQLR